MITSVNALGHTRVLLHKTELTDGLRTLLTLQIAYASIGRPWRHARPGRVLEGDT
jgi:hypothetical protein